MDKSYCATNLLTSHTLKSTLYVQYIAFRYRSKTTGSYNLEQKGLRTKIITTVMGFTFSPPNPGKHCSLGKKKVKLQFNVILGGERGRNCVLLVFEVCVLEWNKHLTTMFSTILSRIAALNLSSHWDVRSAGPSLTLKWFYKAICVLHQMRNYQKSLNFLIHESIADYKRKLG